MNRRMFCISIVSFLALAKSGFVYALDRISRGYSDYTDKRIVVIKGRNIKIDASIADLVDSLNKIGWDTISSCSGHGETDGYIWCKNCLLVISKEQEESEVKHRYLKYFEHMARMNERKSTVLKNGGTIQ